MKPVLALQLLFIESNFKITFPLKDLTVLKHD